MEQCAHMQEWISRMLDEELSAEEQAALAKHLKECPECRNVYEAFAAVSDALRNDLTEAPESLRENVMAELRREEIRKKNRRPWRAVLSAAAVAALVLGLRFGLNGRVPQVTMAASAQPMNGAMEVYSVEESETAPAEDTGAGELTDEAAEQEVQVSMNSRAAAAPKAVLDTALPFFDLSATMSLEELLEYLGGEPLPEDPDPAAWELRAVAACTDGSLELYEYEGTLYYYAPSDGTPMKTPRTAAELESLAEA